MPRLAGTGGSDKFRRFRVSGRARGMGLLRVPVPDPRAPGFRKEAQRPRGASEEREGLASSAERRSEVTARREAARSHLGCPGWRQRQTAAGDGDPNGFSAGGGQRAGVPADDDPAGGTSGPAVAAGR